MFQSFFGLREQPFGVTPDPRYLYLGPGHREALASLIYGLEANRGFLALIAKPGMGKTTLLFHLLERFHDTARTAFVFQTQCNSREFMRFLLSELGLESQETDFVRMHEQFNRCLVQEARAGRKFLIVVDEAQNLDASVLETVRLLSDFETPKSKLVQIILAGQPQLADKLASPELSQLRQRVSSVIGLHPLSVSETGMFIEHRLKVAGYQGALPLFTADATALICELSEGTPREINNYCFNSMSLAFAMKKKQVDTAMVHEVASDLDIQRLVTQRARKGTSVRTAMAASGVDEPVNFAVLRNLDPPAVEEPAPDGLSPAEAVKYLRNVTRLLKRWESSISDPSSRRSM